jgi:hypothetical protein
MNSAAVEEIERAETPEEQAAKIDNALVSAAKELQEEARLAKQQAEAAKAHAIEVEAAADARARDAEKRAGEAVERERARGAEALKNEAARSDDAVRNEQARAEQQREASEARHRRELELEKQRTARHAALARRTKRRALLGAALVVGVVVFLLLALVGGAGKAWQYVLAFAVLAGLLAVADQFLGRSDDIPEEPDDAPVS